jgi:hypothetical protein
VETIICSARTGEGLGAWTDWLAHVPAREEVIA